MCERLALTCEGAALQQAFSLAEPVEHELRDDVKGHQSFSIVVAKEEGRAVHLASWGLVFSWVEVPAAFRDRTLHLPYRTALNSRYYRRLTLGKRCAVPLSGFSLRSAESGALVQVKRADGALFAAAGIYDVWQRTGANKLSFALITKAAEAPCNAYADLQPALLEPDHVDAWLLGEPDGAEDFPFEPELRVHQVEDAAAREGDSSLEQPS